MKLKKEVKRLLMRPEYLGLLMHKTGKTHATIVRWLQTDYKDLQLPQTVAIIEEITGRSRRELYEL